MKPSFFDFPFIPAPEPCLPESRISGLGQKGVFCIVLCPEGQDPEALKSFLGKVLGAAKIGLHEDTYTLLLQESEAISFSSLQRGLNIKTLLLFGLPPQKAGLGFALPLYQPALFGGARFLAADPLHDILAERQAGGKAMSGKLWTGLKTLFLP